MPVACPWFEPTLKAASQDRPAPARTPLGAVFTGLCHASRLTSESAPSQPPDDLIWDACNFGYGRNRCPHFPLSSEADAVRFSQHHGQLLWILEKDYHPLRHGIAESGTPTPILARQAEVFRTTCLNQHP